MLRHSGLPPNWEGDGRLVVGPPAEGYKLGATGGIEMHTFLNEEAELEVGGGADRKSVV